MTLTTLLKKFRRGEDGAILAEFAITLPIIILIFGVIVESGRIFWSYQAAVSGVRDASRYLSRVAAVDICVTGGSVDAFRSDLTTMVGETMSGGSVFPASVSLIDLNASVTCIPGSYRIDPVPVAIVVADVRVTFPFSGAMRLFGSEMTTVTTQVESQSRIFGL